MIKTFNLISLLLLSITSVIAQEDSYSTNVNRSNNEAAPAYSQNYGKSTVAPDTDDCPDSVEAVPAYDASDKAPVESPSSVTTTPTNNSVASIELEAEDCPDSEEGKHGNGDGMPDMTKYESNHVSPSYDQTFPIHNHAILPSPDCESGLPESNLGYQAPIYTSNYIAPEVEAAPTSVAPEVEAAPTSVAPAVESTPTSVAPAVESTPTSVAPIIEAPSTGVAPFEDSTTTSYTNEVNKSSIAAPSQVSPYVAANPSDVSPYVAAIPNEVEPYVAPTSNYVAPYIAPTSSYVTPTPISSYVSPTNYPASPIVPLPPPECLTGECKVRYELVAIDDCTSRTLSKIPLPHSLANFQNLLHKVDLNNETGRMRTQVEPYGQDQDDETSQ